MGTTMTAVHLWRDAALIAQVGDSRAYVWRQGAFTQVTRDQSLVNQLLETGQITAEQAKFFEHSNVILQALGVQEEVEVQLSKVELRRGDRLMLCSDGLVGVVSDEEIGAVVGVDRRSGRGRAHPHRDGQRRRRPRQHHRHRRPRRRRGAARGDRRRRARPSRTGGSIPSRRRLRAARATTASARRR